MLGVRDGDPRSSGVSKAGLEGARGQGGLWATLQMPLIAQWPLTGWLVVVAGPPKEEVKGLTFAEGLPWPGPQ